MKYKILCSSLLLTIIGFSSCNSESKKKYEKLDELSWLIGNWGTTLDGGTVTENWIKSNDSTYIGTSFYIQGKDTLHDERIQVTQKGELLYYIPTVRGQNNNEPISFTLVDSISDSFIFVNKTHDYPQKIEYKKMSEKQLRATISGVQEGKKSSENYVLGRK